MTFDSWLASKGMVAEFSQAEGAVYIIKDGSQVLRIARDDLNKVKGHDERIRLVKESLNI